MGWCFTNNSITVLSGGCSNAVDVCDIKLLLRRLISWWVVLRNQDFFNKAEFLCSSTSLMIWRLSSKPGHSSTTAAKPRRLPKTESPCSSDSALIFALSDVSRQLHCSPTATAACQKFPTAPCSPTRGLLRPPAWLCASAHIKVLG